MFCVIYFSEFFLGGGGNHYCDEVGKNGVFRYSY